MAPWSKEAGPLGKAQKEGDALKKKVDVAVKEALKVANNKKLADRETKLEQTYSNCMLTKVLVQTHSGILEKLKEDEEPTKLKDFEKRKAAELTRTNAMATQLTEAMKKLFPDRNEAEHLKKILPHESGIKDKAEAVVKTAQILKGGEEEKDDDEDDEDDEEETEEDDEDKEEESTTEKKAPSRVQAKNDDDDEEEEEGDDDEEDDDDEEENEEKQRKDVTVQQEKKKPETDEEEEDSGEDDDEEEEDDDEEEEEDEEDSETSPKSKKETKPQGKRKSGNEMEVTNSAHRFVAIQEYEGEEEGDLSFEKGDVLTIVETREDGWWIAENEKGDKGLVPSTFLKIHNQYKGVQLDDKDDEDDEEEENEEANESSESPRKSGKALWGGIKSTVHETTVSDVLHAMGAVPSGFRISTLCNKFNEDKAYRMANYLAPKLSKSNLAYRDLSFDVATNRIRSRPARIERLITLTSCLQIPPPGAGIEVLDRHVRICLFDGQHILSNIHSVKVASVDKSTRSWSFTTRVHDLMDPHMHGEIFVKTNNTSDNIGLLFELCISYKRTSTQEKGEFSCGWVHLPLLENGTIVANKSCDLYVHGGTFYEKGVEVDPSISRRASNALVTLISGNKQPRLLVKVHVPRPIHKDLMDTLPETLVGNTCLLRLYSYYRQWQADRLLRDRIDLDSTELVHDPLLKEFPHAADTPDLMEFFTHEWIRTLREVKKDEKQDEEYMKELFLKVFMESVYPVSHLAMLPEYIMGDTENAQLRRESVTRFAELKRVEKSALAALLSPDLVYEPFLLDEVAFSILGPHCVDKRELRAAV